jgi:GntR family transcriptional regulator
VGKGTYVCPPKINQALQSLSSFTDDMRRRGQRPSSRVLHVGIEPADDETARALGLIPGTECLTLIRVRMADDEPIALEKCYVVYTLCPKILDHHDFAQESLYQVLREEYGIRMTYAHQTIEAQVVNDDEIRSALETKHGAPILSVVRVTYNDQDEPFEYVRSAYRGDRYKFHTVLRLVE